MTVAKVRAALLVVLLAGCATTEERYLTKEQDDAMRRICTPAGCTVLPMPAWQEIQELLRMLQQGGQPSRIIEQMEG